MAIGIGDDFVDGYCSSCGRYDPVWQTFRLKVASCSDRNHGKVPTPRKHGKHEAPKDFGGPDIHPVAH